MMRSMVYEVAENGSNLDQFILPSKNKEKHIKPHAGRADYTTVASQVF